MHFQKASVCISKTRESKDGEKGQGLSLNSGKVQALDEGGFRERGLRGHPKHRQDGHQVLGTQHLLLLPAGVWASEPQRYSN